MILTVDGNSKERYCIRLCAIGLIVDHWNLKMFIAQTLGMNIKFSVKYFRAGSPGHY